MRHFLGLVGMSGSGLWLVPFMLALAHGNVLACMGQLECACTLMGAPSSLYAWCMHVVPLKIVWYGSTALRKDRWHFCYSVCACVWPGGPATMGVAYALEMTSLSVTITNDGDEQVQLQGVIH